MTAPKQEIELQGCTASPMAAYLKALAVLRIAAEQAGDPSVAGFWRNDMFVLRTTLLPKALHEFFLERYQPTPLLAPWNGGSGFYPKDNRLAIDRLARARSPRFATYRNAIDFARDVVRRFSLRESPKEEQKTSFFQTLRNSAPEGLLRWIDAAVTITDDDPRYPPLLGTGGNDGRLDFTNNFMQQLTGLFDVDTGNARSSAAELLDAAMMGTAVTGLESRPIGQFSPGAAGGPNASSGFDGDPQVNPWDFVLMLEGAVLLAASSTRRLESSNSAAMSAPFTVRSRAATVGAAALRDDDDARGEIWMPLWSAPATLGELAQLFSEGRVTVGHRAAKDGLDFVRAIGRLGIDRGIDAFQRYSFLKRSGKAYLASPTSRVIVARNPDVNLIDDLEGNDWLGRVQRFARDETSPPAFRTVVRQLDGALFALSRRTDRYAVERVLGLVGRIDALAAVSAKIRDSVPPAPHLTPEWVRKADDESPEFRIAWALSGLTFEATREGQKPIRLGLRPHLTPVTADGRKWDTESHLVCWGPGPLVTNLVALFHRRRLEASRFGADGEMLMSRKGTSLADVVAFLEKETDDSRVSALMPGLACVAPPIRPLSEPTQTTAVPAMFGFLKVLFLPESVQRAVLGKWLPAERTLHLPAEIILRLIGDDVEGAVGLGWRRLHAAGAPLAGRRPPAATTVDGRRLLAALMLPLTFAETERLIDSIGLQGNREGSSIARFN